MIRKMLRNAFVVCLLTAAPPVHGAKLVYEPLSVEAAALGRVAKYRSVEKRAAQVRLGGLVLDVRVPVRCDAYDAVPIEYALSGTSDPDDRVAIEVVAFEEEDRRGGRDLYDLALPGNMKVRIEYLGSQTGIFDPKRVTRLTQTSRHTKYPPYRLEALTRSGTVKRGNYLFFQFRVTNIGDTILDAEGFGGWMAMPQVFAVDKDGARRHVADTINRFERHLRYVYPGESFEQWVSFLVPGQPATHAHTLPAGRHVILYQGLYRWNRDWDWGVNLWGGKPWAGLEVPIEVAEKPAPTPVTPKEVVLDGGETDRMTRYVRSLEEFMTSFRVFEKKELAGPQKGTIHLQVAPWTRHVVVKLIGNTPGRIRTAVVPVAVAADVLKIRPNPENPFVVVQGGKREAAFATQMMPAMRSASQIGPRPEKHLRDTLREAKECGLNVISSTGGDWHLPEVYTPNMFVGDISAETFKHYYDVIVRSFRLPVFGWGVFPPRTPQMKGLGESFLGHPVDIPFIACTYMYSSRPEVDVAHPDYPKLYAAAILFNYKRWGHTWYRTADGDVPIDVEDTWGWLRDDIHVRYCMGEHALRRFREWARAKYGMIEAANRAWGTAYTSFDEIDPQKGQPSAGKVFGADLSAQQPEYTDTANPFHDWSPAVDDWDLFRTELRCDVYEAILAEVRKAIPRAQINLRTEGACIPVAVPKDADAAHLRHVRYAQRRNALVAEVLERRKVFRYHSDYTTQPFTETEWRMLLRQLRRMGIRGNYLPQFCTARDMVLNDDYGRDYTRHYNLSSPKKAVMMHVLQAAYPVWRIQYEEGHLPGVLWEDYMCDGFVTETQKRELRLFREHLDACASSPQPPR